MSETYNWKGALTRQEAIRIIGRATDRDDPFWEYLVADFYDEESDTLPTLPDVLAALGVTKNEAAEAGVLGDNPQSYWPVTQEQP